MEQTEFEEIISSFSYDLSEEQKEILCKLLSHDNFSNKIVPFEICSVDLEDLEMIVSNIIFIIENNNVWNSSISNIQKVIYKEFFADSVNL